VVEAILTIRLPFFAGMEGKTMQATNRCMGNRQVPVRIAPGRAAPERRRPRASDGSFSVILPPVYGHKWQIVPGPSGQKLVAVDNKSLPPTDEEIIAVAAPLFMLLIAFIMVIPLII
jgi:hypothetical protein